MSSPETEPTLISSRPVTASVFGAVAFGSFATGITQLVNGHTGFGLFSLAGALAWGLMTATRMMAGVRISPSAISTTGHLDESIDCTHITNISMLKSSRMTYDLSVLTDDGVIHRVASHVGRASADRLHVALRHALPVISNA